MPVEEPASESRSSSRASSIRSTSSSPKQPTKSTQEPLKNDQVPAARPGPISRLISSSARLPSHSSSHSSFSSPPTRRQRPDRQASTTSSSRISFEREGRPPHPRNSSSTTSTRRKPRPQNVAGPTTEQSYNAAGSSGGGGLQNSMFKRMDSTQGGGSAFNGGGGGSTASGASQTGGDEKPLWAMGGVFPTKDRRKSSVAKDWAKSREKERRELKRQEKRSRRKGPERMDSAITEHSSTVGGEGDGGLPSDTIVEQEDPFDRYNGEEARGSGEETDESANAQSDNSGMSRGGSTVGHPVKRQDHEDSANEIESNAVAEESETASELARRRSPGESTLAEQEQKKHDDEYDEKVDRGRDQVEQDSKKGGKTPRSGRNGGEDFDEDSWSVGSGDTGADSDTPQVGGQLNQNKEDWQDDMTPDGPPVRNAWGTIRYALREPMAEFLGTLMLVVLGIGADCQVKISGATAGDYSSQNWTWGFAVMISVYVAGGISGGHTNPAVTISLAIFRGFPWKMVPRYVIAQVLGAFVGALMVYGNYKRAIHDYDPNQLIHAQADPPLNASATLFFTAPATQVGTTPLGFAQEVLAGGILMIAVLALGDENNAPPGAGLGAIVLGFVVVAIGMSNGWVSGYAINPARDLGPRLALWAVGYGTKVWTHDDCWWIFGPLLGPLVGSLGGCLAYDMFIFAGPGSPVNWSAHELAASVGVPQMYHLAKRAAHPKARHKQAQAERDLEATLPTDGRRANIIRRAEFTGQERPGRKGSTERKDLEVVQRWRRGRDKVEKQNDYNRGKYEEARKKSIERQKRQVKERSDAIQSAFAAELENDEVVHRPEESHKRQ